MKAIIKTNKGDMSFDLMPEAAPKTEIGRAHV